VVEAAEVVVAEVVEAAAEQQPQAQAKAMSFHRHKRSNPTPQRRSITSTYLFLKTLP
jgi:membrane-bound lytic murein transglycosylase